MIIVKEIRVFSNANEFSLATEVNNFLRSTEHNIVDIQYGVSRGIYSVMIVIEVK